MPMTYRIISADAHIEVPPDQWARRVPAKFRDLAPKCWPHSRAVLTKRFAAAAVPEDEQYKIVACNAIEFFHLNGKGTGN